MTDLTTISQAEAWAKLEQHLEGLRTPCLCLAHGHDPGTCVICEHRGYIPRRGLEALLDAMAQIGFNARIEAFAGGSQIVRFWGYILVGDGLPAYISHAEVGDGLALVALRAAVAAIEELELLKLPVVHHDA